MTSLSTASWKRSFCLQRGCLLLSSPVPQASTYPGLPSLTKHTKGLLPYTLREMRSEVFVFRILYTFSKQPFYQRLQTSSSQKLTIVNAHLYYLLNTAYPGGSTDHRELKHVPLVESLPSSLLFTLFLFFTEFLSFLSSPLRISFSFFPLPNFCF